MLSKLHAGMQARHPDNDDVYVVKDIDMKLQDSNGYWHPGVYYESMTTNKRYSRRLDSFMERFDHVDRSVLPDRVGCGCEICIPR